MGYCYYGDLKQLWLAVAFMGSSSVAKFFRSNLLHLKLTWTHGWGQVAMCEPCEPRLISQLWMKGLQFDVASHQFHQGFFQGPNGEAWSSGPVVPATDRATWGQQSFGQLRPFPRCSSPLHPRWSGRGESSNPGSGVSKWFKDVQGKICGNRMEPLYNR
jgi:hypothetical protein